MRAPPKLIVNATRENNPVRLRDRLRRHRPIPRVDRRLGTRPPRRAYRPGSSAAVPAPRRLRPPPPVTGIDRPLKYGLRGFWITSASEHLPKPPGSPSRGRPERRPSHLGPRSSSPFSQRRSSRMPHQHHSSFSIPIRTASTGGSRLFSPASTVGERVVAEVPKRWPGHQQPGCRIEDAQESCPLSSPHATIRVGSKQSERLSELVRPFPMEQIETDPVRKIAVEGLHSACG